MSQKIAFFDLDGTLFRWQLFHELVFELKNLHLFDTATAQELDDALIGWQGKTTTWHEYETILMDGLKRHLTGMPVDIFEQAAANVISKSGHKIYNYTAKLAAQLKQDGYYLLAVTGSYQEVAEPFARRYGFDDCIGALLPRKDGVFTGPDSERVVFGQKVERIQEYLDGKDFTLQDSVAVGDSGGDVPMLEMAEQPIAFNPSDDLVDIAIQNHWRIVIERKSIAYTLEHNDGSIVLAKTDRF